MCPYHFIMITDIYFKQEVKDLWYIGEICDLLNLDIVGEDPHQARIFGSEPRRGARRPNLSLWIVKSQMCQNKTH